MQHQKYLYIPNTKSKVNKLQCITNVPGEKKLRFFCTVFSSSVGYCYFKFIEYWWSARLIIFFFFMKIIHLFIFLNNSINTYTNSVVYFLRVKCTCNLNFSGAGQPKKEKYSSRTCNMYRKDYFANSWTHIWCTVCNMNAALYSYTIQALWTDFT